MQDRLDGADDERQGDEQQGEVDRPARVRRVDSERAVRSVEREQREAGDDRRQRERQVDQRVHEPLPAEGVAHEDPRDDRPEQRIGERDEHRGGEAQL